MTEKFDHLVDELAALCGIIPDYWDIFGKKHITSTETKRAILSAMKIKTATEADAAREIEERRTLNWKMFVDPVHVISVNQQPFSIPVYISLSNDHEKDLEISWSIEDEHGSSDTASFPSGSFAVSEEKWIDEKRYVKINLTDNKKRETGYHHVAVTCRHPERIFPDGQDLIKRTVRLIVAPDSCYLPDAKETAKSWGLAVNLYAIHSSENWGIGDFTDLSKVLKWVSGLGGGFAGINPLHAIPNTNPYGISPYSPISRLYRNFLYLDITSIPEFKDASRQDPELLSASFKKEVDDLRKSPFIDYERAALLKKKALHKAFEVFYDKHFNRATSRGKGFKKYCSSQGRSLELFGVFMALWDDMKRKKDVYSWKDWPEAFQDPAGEQVREFSRTYHREVLFYLYVQWLIEEQLSKASSVSEKEGMAVGIYNDLAIGAISGGSDVWSNQGLFGDADVGAPPDDFSPDGQNWGFPPMIPEKMRESGYELFIRTMQKNMRHGGALRIDHALGLFRLFWIPSGMTAAYGAYVECPSEDLLRIIALESVRNKTIIIAEDLGTIGENVRETLSRFNMLSYRLFYFERNYPDPSFVPPDEYPELALCSVTTHDLPTLTGYWVGQDIMMRKKLGKYADEAMYQQQLKERERDKGLIIAALKEQGLLPDDFPSEVAAVPEMTPELCRAIYGYLSRTPCRLTLVSLDDIIGTLNQQNMPGTVDTHPNWIQKTPVLLKDMMKDKRFAELAEVLNENLHKE